MLVGGGSVCLGYTGQSLFLPNWFVRRRGLAMSLAFSGVGVGSIILLPWLQAMIARAGWRAACWALAILVLVLLVPLNLLLRRRPEDIGLEPDGDRVVARDRGARSARERRGSGLGRGRLDARPRHAHGALLVDRASAISAALFAWYAVQVHQTKYLVEIGFSPTLRRLGAGRREPRRRSRARSRSAICPTASAANGCGRSAAWASPSATWRCSLMRESPTPALL